MSSLKKEYFYDTLTQENRVLPYYDRLTNTINNECLYNSKSKHSKSKKVISISLCPSFLNYSIALSNYLIIKKIEQKNIIGYAILLKDYKNLESLFKLEYKKAFRDNIKRLNNRLETCFDVKYEINHGSIDFKKYETLMYSLKIMLSKRFEQRGDRTDVLKNWNHYFETTYDFVLQKKASIFAIYANEKLIHVCVNHHFNNILFVSIPSYDINYSKFALGNISIFNLLEWCIENKYFMLDMAYGDLDYKRRWSNYNYTFEHQILAPINNPYLIFLGSAELLLIKTKNILKKYKFDYYFKKLKQIFYRKKSDFNKLLYFSEVVEFKNDVNFRSLDLAQLENYKLNKPICDFLYTHKEHISNVNVFEVIKSKEYIINANSKSERIIFL